MAGLIVVSYDVPDDRRRTRLAHALKDFGARVQYSVFECRLDVDGLEKLRAGILRLVDVQEDRVRIYRLCEGCAAKGEIHGPDGEADSLEFSSSDWQEPCLTRIVPPPKRHFWPAHNCSPGSRMESAV